MKSSPTLLALAAAGALALFAAPSLAQNYDDQSYYNSDEEIIVTAPGVRHDPSTGAPVETFDQQRAIDTSDLDLRYDNDVDELYRRIDETVAAACHDVNRALPAPVESPRQCVHDAREDAMAQAADLIATARG